MIKPLAILAALILPLTLAGRVGAAGQDMLPDAILYPAEKPGHILVVDKADQMLYLYSHDQEGQVTLERVMPCSTGERKGDKLVEGDKKTPNGFYIFNQKLLPRELSPIYGTLAYPTDYPNFWDKKLKRGGYGIWIHGINKPLVDYDSNGCVELENADIAQMEELIRLHDTPLLTYESLTLAPVEELKREGQAVKDFIELWRRSWVDKDQATYRRLYDPDFVNSDGRSFDGWMTHKENVAKKYQTITVEVKDLRIYRHRDVITAVFEQDYRGDNYFTSVGLKRLYIKQDEGGYKILAEEFKPMPVSETKKWLTATEKKKALETPPLVVAKAVKKTPMPSERSRTTAEVKSLAETLVRGEADRQPLTDDWDSEEEPNGSDPAEEARQEAAAKAAAAADASAKAASEARARAAADKKARAAETKAIEEALAAEAKARQEEAQAAEAKAREEEALAAEAQRRLPARENLSGGDAVEAVDEALAEALISVVRQWAVVWGQRNVEAYLSYYHPDFYFKSKNMKLGGFTRYKKMLIENANIIEVEVSNFSVRKDEGNLVKVSFQQKYRSDNIRDLGIKTLTFKDDQGTWKIVAETWSPL